jgi:hypothetical protein
MNHSLHNINGQVIAELHANGTTIRDAQQFLEIMMNLPADKMVIHQACIDESFFDLRSGLAGEILQKVVNYSRQLGIVGDFSSHESKSLRDFIRESNKSNTVVFVATLDDALKRLSA